MIKSCSTCDLHGTLFSGQSFMWNNIDAGYDYYASIIDSSAVFIRKLSSHEFEVYSDSSMIYGISVPSFITSYLSIDIDINKVFHDRFQKSYPELWKLLSGYFSLRVLRQDFFETMITFMCAQGIGMHLIRKQVTMLCQMYGEKRALLFGEKLINLYSFPTPLSLAEADISILSRCTNNNRIRAANIARAARAFSEGVIDHEMLRNPQLPLPELRRVLCLNPGIGYKIADCIALFGLGRFDAFPIDTHVKQYLAHWFRSPEALKPLTPARYLELDREARTIFNPEFAGYAGHLLFHCWRREIKKLRTF
ncbi:Fe-S cluster assembly protein HesB [Chlorobium sp. BLA1]|nr:Fe-S cluster assembly protein HesB [Candidatus Chlorobium masyuteum]